MEANDPALRHVPDTSTVVIDCDAGQDDAIALLLAHGSESIRRRLTMVTTVAGNSPGPVTNLNARRVMGFISRHGFDETDVLSGMNRAVMRPMRTYFRSDQPLPGWSDDSVPTKETPGSAIDGIVDIVRRSPARTVTICALGPLTNIAMAILVDGTFARRVDKVVWMGGSIGAGNITPAAEFNALADPEAVRIVAESGLELVVVPAEIGEAAAVDDTMLSRIEDLGTPFASATADLICSLGNHADHDRYVSDGRPMYDPTVIAYLAEPSMFTVARARLVIDTNDGPSLGATLFDLDVNENQTTIAVVVDVDRDRFHRFLLASLALHDPAPTASH